jgi:hypothetical protein
VRPRARACHLGGVLAGDQFDPPPGYLNTASIGLPPVYDDDPDVDRALEALEAARMSLAR